MRLPSASAVIASAMGLVSCMFESEYSNAAFDHLEYRRISSAPGLVSLEPREIQMERGVAVGARVSAIGVDGEPIDLLELRSSDDSVFVVDLGPRLGEYVFHGARAGSATVQIYGNGALKDEVPVTVLEQTP